MGVQFTLRLVRTFSFTGGFPFLAIAVTIPIGILLLMGIVACVCCICVCKKPGIRGRDFWSKRDCDNCFECHEHDELCSCCRNIVGFLVWILLFPISCPYYMIISCWNDLGELEKGSERYVNPMPCIED